MTVVIASGQWEITQWLILESQSNASTSFFICAMVLKVMWMNWLIYEIYKFKTVKEVGNKMVVNQLW